MTDIDKTTHNKAIKAALEGIGNDKDIDIKNAIDEIVNYIPIEEFINNKKLRNAVELLAQSYLQPQGDKND